MPLTERKRTMLTGSALALGVLATRLPFISHYLNEFDSVDFAIATFRFDLSQFTPHPPGYILHVLLGRFFLLFTKDINLAFVWLSILLSVGSVLLLWRAAARLRGERVGVVAATLWLFAPMFWFFGEVATSYVHEAFFASALIYIGIRIIKERENVALLYILAIMFSLSIAARQSSVIFFGPAVLYLLFRFPSPRSAVLKAISLLGAVTAVWVLVLINESGGLQQFLEALGKESLYTTQSVFFGNPISEHIGVLTKLGWYLTIGALPVILIALYGIIVFRGEMIQFIRTSLARSTTKFVLFLALPALLFYSLIYFMKAGYLLNILPCVYLVGAVIFDHIMILHAKRVREKHKGEILLTRKLITKFTLIGLVVIVSFEALWFTVPAPGKEFTPYADLFSHQTYRESLESRFEGQESKSAFFLNKAFAYASSAGVRNIDSIHNAVYTLITHEGSDPTTTVVFDTWWQRYSYFYFPNSTCYDIRSYSADTLFSCLRMKDYTLYPVATTETLPRNARDIFIIIREEHPDLKLIKQQVHLEKVDAPLHIDIYRVTDSVFTLQWKNVRFVKE